MTSTGRSGGRRPPSCWPTCCWPPTWPTAPCWMPTAGSTTSPTTLRYGILRAAGHAAAADSLAGTQGLHPETRGSVYFTARAGCASLRDNDIARWVTPQPGLAEFCPGRFVEQRETLYLLSKNVAGGTSAAALVSALTTEVRIAAGDVLAQQVQR